ncbi:MAG: hypothetical protein HWD92_09410 [Flavobacteriia bacterium]|nr:hypothetical protein [Flavobacteriia bacterium]
MKPHALFLLSIIILTACKDDIVPVDDNNDYRNEYLGTYTGLFSTTISYPYQIDSVTWGTYTGVAYDNATLILSKGTCDSCIVFTVAPDTLAGQWSVECNIDTAGTFRGSFYEGTYYGEAFGTCEPGMVAISRYVMCGRTCQTWSGMKGYR